MARGPGAAAPGPRHVGTAEARGAHSLVGMDPATLRAEFPVFERFAYLNAGTCGPLPRCRQHGRRRDARARHRAGPQHAYFEAGSTAATRLRDAYAALLRASSDDVALTTCTSEGIVRILGALDLRAGDEVLTSDEEHPGLQGPLAAARDQRGIVVRAVPFARDRRATVGPQTKLVACSHVSWVNGRAVSGLGDLGDVPVLLDGAQGVGAVPIDVAALGCAFYAGSGQKWLCGPVGSGMLWIDPRWSDRVPSPGPTYMNLEDPAAGLDAVPRATAARHDASAQSAETCAAALAALERARRRRLGGRLRAGGRARRAAGRRARRARSRGRSRATARRSCHGRTPTRPRRACGSPRPA